MAITLARKNVSCPNCQHQGKAKIKASGGESATMLIGIVLIAVGLFITWPALIVGLGMCALTFLMPAKQVCKKCGFPHPIPL